jgi:hypothetical protein
MSLKVTSLIIKGNFKNKMYLTLHSSWESIPKL